MSLVADASLRKYYEDASQNIEGRSRAFWFAVLRRSFDFRFEITPGYSPDDSHQRRVDAAIEQYRENQDHLVVMLWVESRYPGHSLGEVEVRVLDAARKCLEKSSSRPILAMTTIGPCFRVWRVDPGHEKLVPLHGRDSTSDQGEYIDADSVAAVAFTNSIKEIKVGSQL